MKHPLVPLTVVVAMGALAACGSSGLGASKRERSAGSSASVSPAVQATTLTADPTSSAASPADPFAPNIGDRALTVGQTRHGRDVTTTLSEIKYPYPPAEYREPSPGQVFIGLRIKQCVRMTSRASNDLTSTYNGEWYIATPNGNQYPGSGESWKDWPSPKFPEYVTMNPGECIQGWIDVEVPDGIRIKKVVWRPDDETTAEWLSTAKK